MPSARGFDKIEGLQRRAARRCPAAAPTWSKGCIAGGTSSARCPTGQQSGLRVIVLFTDGASNSVPGNYDAAPGLGRALRTYDFPKVLPDPDGQTHDNPHDRRALPTNSANSPSGPSINGATGRPTSCRRTGTTRALSTADFNDVNARRSRRICRSTSYHAHHRSSGIPTSFPLQIELAHGERHGRSPRARRLRDINAATEPLSGRGLQHQQRGAQPGRDHRQRRARRRRRRLPDPHLHDRHGRAGALQARHAEREVRRHPQADRQRHGTSPDFNAAQLEGKYYFAKTAADVGPAFQALQNQIMRLSK